jgi:hypothetical protein
MGLLKDLGKKVSVTVQKPLVFVNVVFRFDLGPAEKYVVKDNLKVRADGKDLVTVKPESSTAAKLREGSNLLRLWLDGQGKEKGVVDSTVTLVKGNNYEVTYSYSSTSNTGRISVRTI